MGRHHQENIVIIGAGIAGLSAACHLAESGHPPLVIDSEAFPRHRVCGQFLSSESLPLLRRWGLAPPTLIERCVFKQGQKEILLPLHEQAGSWSRYDFDETLMQKAKSLGASILTQTKVDRWERSDKKWNLTLSNGETRSADLLIVGAGRLASQTFRPRYRGFKAHFSGISLHKQLDMYLFEGGYVGVSPIGPDTINVAGIAPLHTDLSTFLSSKGLETLQETLSQATPLFLDWMSASIPPFGIRRPPNYPNVLWIGDAAGSIPPICGKGLTLAMASGALAAEYALTGRVKEFRRAWLKKFRSCFRFASLLHACAMNPGFSRGLFYTCQQFPRLPLHLFSWTQLSTQ